MFMCSVHGHTGRPYVQLNYRTHHTFVSEINKKTCAEQIASHLIKMMGENSTFFAFSGHMCSSEIRNNEWVLNICIQIAFTVYCAPEMFLRATYSWRTFLRIAIVIMFAPEWVLTYSNYFFFGEISTQIQTQTCRYCELNLNLIQFGKHTNLQLDFRCDVNKLTTL